MNRRHLVYILLCFILLVSCKEKKAEPQKNDFELIKEKGELTIITLNSSTSYFLYKDEPMGYNYDLAEDFCMQHNLKLNIKLAENVNKLLELLESGEGDLIAFEVPIRSDLKDSILFCGPSQISHQVLVQRANPGDTLVKDVTGLLGKDIYVKYDTKHHQRIVNLNTELGGGINIKNIEKDTITSEDLIKMVSLGEIRYTISDEYIAKLNRTYYRNINISLPVSFDQKSSWVVRKESTHLADALNKWFEGKDQTPVYKSIVKKYFESGKQGDFEEETVVSQKLTKGAISVYDPLFKQYATSRFDWQLLAAISYQESRFINNLTSWAGASGIMGLMPRTARSLGLSNDDRMNPELSIYAAVQLLGKLEKIFKDIENPEERLKFVLAAYNAGHGHIKDGQALARKYGADPNVWEGNVSEYIKLKRLPEYYNDSVCKNGYFRGTETIAYVNKVTANRAKYKQKTEEKIR